MARFFLLCLFFFVLFCALGVWQLHRYQDKKQLLDTYQKHLVEQPMSLQKLPSNEKQFRRIYVEGHYRNDLTMLIQNRFHEGRFGFEILTPFAVKGETKLLLINRGWLQKPADSMLPTIQAAEGEQRVVGYIKLLDEKSFTLGKNILNPTAMPIVMQKIDVNELSRITHREFYPFILRLDPEQSNGFARDWVIATVMPQRHMAYAVQWFALALLVMMGGWIVSKKQFHCGIN